MKGLKCQCPLGLIPHFYCMDSTGLMPMRTRVSMPSRAYTSFLLCSLQAILQYLYSCQCPLGLIPHFYIKTLYTSIRKAGCVNALSGLYLISTLSGQLKTGHTTAYSVNALSGLYLISTLDPLLVTNTAISRVNALSGLYLISTVPLQKHRFYAVSRACFCRYLSEYSDNSRFSCMLTFWTYLMRCTYP